VKEGRKVKKKRKKERKKERKCYSSRKKEFASTRVASSRICLSLQEFRGL
jgi:hypothetical protein